MRLQFKDLTVNIVSVNEKEHSSDEHLGWHTVQGKDHVIFLTPHTAYGTGVTLEATLLHELCHMALAHAGVSLPSLTEEQVCEAMEMLSPLFFDKLAEIIDIVITEPTRMVK